MAKVDDVLKSMILLHGRRITGEVGELPAQIREMRQEVRHLREAVHDLGGLMKQVVGVLQRGPELPARAVSSKPIAPRSIRHLTGETDQQTGLPPAEIHHIRENAGLNVQEMARAIGVTRASIWAWEKGRSKPMAQSIEKMLAMKSRTEHGTD